MPIDQKSRASQVDLQVDCSKAGPGYSNMDDAEIRLRKRFMPPGCNLVSGQGNFVYVFLLASFVLYLAMALVYPTNIYLR